MFTENKVLISRFGNTTQFFVTLCLVLPPLRTMSDSTSTSSSTPSRFGFVAFAETWNGRLAMMGFVIGLATELLTGQGILSQIGLG